MKLFTKSSSRRARCSAISAIEYLGSTPRNSGRSPAWRFRSTRTVRAEVEAARFVEMNDVPHPPLLENTATMRPFFRGASTRSAQNSQVRSRTVFNSSGLIGNWRKSRAPARRLRIIRSGEASCPAEIRAMFGHSAASRLMNANAGSALTPRAITAAFGFSRAISSCNCSASLPPASKRTRLSPESALRICLKLSRPVLSTTNVREFVIVVKAAFALEMGGEQTSALAGQGRSVVGHVNRRVEQRQHKLKLIIGDA